MHSQGLKIGDSLGSRRVVAMIGRGGMGVVYRVWNERLERDEAVKVIADELARDSNFRGRFLREAKIVADLEHPHVIPVYDADEEPTGLLFMAMRYVEEGNTLASLLRQRGRLEPSAAAKLISDIASALDSAHVRGLVHRDVKPANILIAGQTTHHPYLTDFGLSKSLSSDTTFTDVGSIVGTVDYMSPEQTRGYPVDGRTDVYALGVTLFEALTGRVPYVGENDMANLAAKVLEPAPMITQVAPGIPSAFDAVLARALARDPDERFPSAGELGRAAQVAAGQPSQVTIQTDIGIGSVLADCLIEGVAGEGGMAVVYRATQQNLGKTVALKVMAPELADDPAFRHRFEREWKIAAAIDHPNVIPIHWAGESHGRLYIVMRFVAGGTLRETLASRGRLEPELAVDVIEQLASALDAAHARGLVHRDIKPGNVLIEDTSGRVYLTDFGLAKDLDDADSTDGKNIMGTFRYLPPERSRDGDVDDVLGDVYSLGCVLWDLLAGPDRVKLEDVESVPPSLAEVVMRSVALEPSARYPSAGELARAARIALDPDTSDGLPDQGKDTRVRATAVKRRKPFEPAPISSGLSERVVALCDTVLALIEGESDARHELESVRHDLEAPLRVAVTGDPGSGRSTLITAILGRRLTQTGDLGDLGTQVTFEYGTQERVKVQLLDGTELEHGLQPDGSLPSELEPMSDQLASVRVCLPLDALRSVTLILTMAAGDSDEAVPGDSPVDPADAFIIALRATSVGDPGELREMLLSRVFDLRISAVNATLLLTKADLAADPASLAEKVKETLGPMVAAVRPFAGLLAETANAGLMTNDDVAMFSELAHTDPTARGQLLGSPEGFLADDALIGRDQRQRLLDRYGLQGVRCALELADAGQLTGVALRRRLREVSGIEEVDRQIDGFHQRADALKAEGALDRLEGLSYRWSELAFLRDLVETARLEPEMHLIDLVRAFERCALGEVDVPADLLVSLERLITARTPGQRLGVSDDSEPAVLRAAAMEGFRAWKMFENSGHASPAAGRVSRVVARSYEIIARES